MDYPVDIVAGIRYHSLRPSLNFAGRQVSGALPAMATSSDIRVLAELTPGQQARVVRIFGPAGIRHRLLEMGLTRGTQVGVVRIAPLGDPLELEVRGYRLSVRKSEAASVVIEDD